MLHDLFQLPSAALMAENRSKALRNTAKTAVERAVAPKSIRISDDAAKHVNETVEIRAELLKSK